jgi:hypothetical protein
VINEYNRMDRSPEHNSPIRDTFINDPQIEEYASSEKEEDRSFVDEASSEEDEAYEEGASVEQEAQESTTSSEQASTEAEPAAASTKQGETATSVTAPSEEDGSYEEGASVTAQSSTEAVAIVEEDAEMLEEFNESSPAPNVLEAKLMELEELGFSNKQQNMALLLKHNLDVAKTVADLLDN